LQFAVDYLFKLHKIILLIPKQAAPALISSFAINASKENMLIENYPRSTQLTAFLRNL
jgi:hypothetical protein